MRNRRISLAAAALSTGLALGVPVASASIIGQVGGSVTLPTATETFDVDRLTNSVTWTGADITLIDLGADAGWGWFGGALPVLGCDSSCIYQNGSTLGVASIALNSGAPIGAIDVRVGNGFSLFDAQFLWVQTFNNGVSTGFDFDFDLAVPGLFSIISQGTEFDEIRVGSYGAANFRDQHNTNNLSAVSIMDVMVGGASVAEPGTLALLGLGLAGLAASRRRTQ